MSSLCYTCDIIYPNLVKQLPNTVTKSRYLVTQCKQMYREYLRTEEQKFGKVKIAHFGLFLPLLGTQENLNAGN